MPTKRRRRTVVWRGLTADEIQWLTGKPQPGTSAIWRYRQWLPGRIERLQEIIETHADAIPAGRLPELERDIQRWGK